MRLKVTATLEAPVTIPDGQPIGNTVATLAYVPGTTLRGALAATWIAQNGVPERTNPKLAEFIELFERNISYGPLLPEGASFEPVSVMRCKYPAETDVVNSTAAGASCHNHLPDRADSATTEADLQRCPACGGPLENGKGQLKLADGGIVYEITRTQLDKNETAADGNLYSTEAIEAGTVLEGYIYGDHPWFNSVQTLYVGRRKTVAGRVRVAITPEPLTPPQLRDDGTIVIRLATPAIVVDDWGQPQLDFDLEQIAAALGCEVSQLGFQAKNAWVRPTTVGGWHAASGLPKPDEIAMAAGSTIRLKPTVVVEATHLAQLARAGIGLRRNEGFGLIEVNPPAWQRPTPASFDSAEATTNTPNVDTSWVRQLNPSDANLLVEVLRARRANPNTVVSYPDRRRRSMDPSLWEHVNAALELEGEELEKTLHALRFERGGIR